MRRNGEELNDQRVMEKILRYLDLKFYVVVIVIDESKDLEQMSLEQLMGYLQANEQRFTRRGEDKSLEQALQIKLALENKGELKSQRGRGCGQRGRDQPTKKHKTTKVNKTTHAKEVKVEAVDEVEIREAKSSTSVVVPIGLLHRMSVISCFGNDQVGMKLAPVFLKPLVSSRNSISTGVTYNVNCSISSLPGNVE